MSKYRLIALALALTFAAVGLLFLVAPAGVASAFEQASRLAAIPALPVGGIESGLFRALAAAYMYLVTWLAWMMFRRPEEAAWPGLLAQAKLASAAFSLFLAIYQGPSLVLLVNGVVDGFLGVLALALRREAIAASPKPGSTGPSGGAEVGGLPVPR